METIWNPDTNYYLEMPIQVLDTPLNLSDLSEFGYPETIEEISNEVKEYYGITDTITLGMLLMTYRFLANGNVAFNIQIRPYCNFIQSSSCVKDFINEMDFEKAKLMYGVGGFLNEDEYTSLVLE